MSLTERRRLQQLTPELPDGSGISRSRSFAGFLNRSLSRKESMNPSSHGHDYRMLIQRSSDQRLRSTKAPKTPRPLRSITIIDSLRNGLQECIQLTNDDMKGLLNGNERLSTQNTQQLKAAERYLKRLELQLSKLEELGENYNVQHRLREGVRNMAQAYMSSSGKERETALGKVKAGFKECTQSMCSLEVQLEQMMGSLEMRMKGIAGFARLCPGDTFEIIVRHGDQKWKSRGHVNKDASQSWDQEAAIFKSLLGDIMHIKASEVRTLGNRIIVGNKHCETKDLFSAHSQVMTISLNSNGSLKLSLIISWNPLDGAADQNVWSPWMLKASDSTLPKTNRGLLETPDRNATARVTEDSLPQRSVYSSAISVGSDRQSSVSPKTEASNAESMSPSDMSVTPNQESLENTIRAVVSSMRDIRGRYPQIFDLETQILRLEKLLLPADYASGRLSRGSNLSISVESALDCFDFLNDVEEEESVKKEAQKSCTVDSGIETMTDGAIARLEKRDFDQQISSGNDQIDLALVQHLVYCDTLLESLGSFGPLKHSESRAVRHLQTQGEVFEILGNLVENPNLLEDFTTLMRDITEKQRLHLLWEQCAGGHYLCTSADSVVTQLKARYVHFFKTFTEIERQDVLELLICQMLDRPAFDPASIVTLFHFLTFLKSDNHWEVEVLLLKFHNDLKVLGSLQSKKSSEVVETLHGLRGKPVDAAYAIQIGVCLLSTESDVEKAARDFLLNSERETALRSWMMKTYAAALEDERAEIRRSACIALRVLKAAEYLQELLHVVYNDLNLAIVEEAKLAVQSFGEIGTTALTAYSAKELSEAAGIRT